MAVGARCKVCDWQVVFSAEYLSAAELAALAKHASACTAIGGKPVDPQSAGSVLERFAITGQ
jgi:hypothetical protein